METKTSEERPTLETPQAPGETKSPAELVLDFFSVLAKHRRFIVWFVLVITVLAGGSAAVGTKWFKGTAIVYPAEQTSLMAGIEGLSSFARTLGLGGRLSGLGLSAELDRYMAILKSESGLMKVIERFDLTRVYEIKAYPREKTMKELLANTEFQISDEGGLVISVYDTDPQRAADMANYFVQVLNETNSRMQAQNATGNREFIEQRLEKGKVDLKAAEEALKEFQEESGMFITPDPSSSGVSAVAELYLIKAKLEVEIGVLERSVSKEYPALEQMRIELAEINKKVNDLPETSVGTLRLYREMVIQQKIMEFLVPIYEQAKVEEKRSTPSVIVLDRAEVPERKAKPKILLYTILSFVVSSVIALFLVFLREGIDRIRALQPERFRSVMSTLRSDWFGLKLRRNAK